MDLSTSCTMPLPVSSNILCISDSATLVTSDNSFATSLLNKRNSCNFCACHVVMSDDPRFNLLMIWRIMSPSRLLYKSDILLDHKSSWCGVILGFLGCIYIDHLPKVR